VCLGKDITEIKWGGGWGGRLGIDFALRLLLFGRQDESGELILSVGGQLYRRPIGEACLSQYLSFY
jgi:hypothetical protein